MSVRVTVFCMSLLTATMAAAQSQPTLQIGTRQGNYYWVVETSADGSRRGGWVPVNVPLDAIERSELKPLPPASALSSAERAPQPPAAPPTLDERLARIEQALAAKQSTVELQAPSLVRSAALNQVSQPRTQTFQPPAAHGTNGSIVGVVGTTFVTEVAPTFGVEVEGRPSRNVGIYGGFGRMQNGAPASLQDAMELASLLTGVPMIAKLPTTYGVGGVRFIAPTSSGLDVYGLVGGGFANIKLTMSAVGVSLPTDLLEDLTGQQLSATKGMIEFGGGVGIPVSRLRIDLGYRFGRPFDTGDESINWSRVQAGVGVGF